MSVPGHQLVGISSGETPRGSSTAGSWLETLTIAVNTVAPTPQTKPKSQNGNSVIASRLAILFPIMDAAPSLRGRFAPRGPGASLRYAAMTQLIIWSQGSTITSNPAK